ncbi:hypothetical protein [uncultured Roseobacter sp.]|uniref:hypothetical protein n=1 Tax=uncultured Roseobacter sp. TaxID=114847 RepID=UPI0026224D85|nr:hypothetical protein [uncultured Roseobacter sp.]
MTKFAMTVKTFVMPHVLAVRFVRAMDPMPIFGLMRIFAAYGMVRAFSIELLGNDPTCDRTQSENAQV